MSVYRGRPEAAGTRSKRRLAVAAQRAELFKDIDVVKLSDADWQKLAEMGWV